MVIPAGFLRPSALGASVIGVNSSIGWGENQSQLTLRLVNDPVNLDNFSPPDTGTPVVFSYYQFSFEGLLQRWVKRNASNGLPTFEVTIVDPRAILEGTYIIVRDYNGATNTVSNLLNAYGFWEDKQLGNGYGGSLVNDAGMPWYLVLEAIQKLTSSAGTTYGGPLEFRGVQYNLDLSNLPVPPSYYRIGASDSLMTMIAQLCQDGGCDYYVTLVGNTIVVNTVNRYDQPPLGTITALVNNNWGGLLKSSDSGLESRNEITSAFLVGGERQDMFLADSSAISSFWGFDNAGFPLTGTPQQTLWQPVWNPVGSTTVSPNAPEGYYYPGEYQDEPPAAPAAVYSQTSPGNSAVMPGGYWNFIAFDEDDPDVHVSVNGYWSWVPLMTDVETMTLNATEIAFILGTGVYNCSTFEMRCALANQETWEAYILKFRPDIAPILGVVCSPYATAQAGALFQQPSDIVNDEVAYAKFLDANVVLGDAMVRQTAVWQFVKKAAETYMGRTYLISIPFAAVKTTPETLQIVFSQQPANDGAFLELGSNPLGLSDANEEFFLSEDGKFIGFAQYGSQNNVYFASLQPDSMVLQDNGVFVRGQMQTQVYLNPLPCVVMELPSPVYRSPADFVGESAALAALFDCDPGQLGNIMGDITGGSLNLLISPDVLRPANIAVPLRSNVMSYGPWYVSGPPGKVAYEYDNSLVPWNFGGMDEMNNAGNARVINAVTFMQEGETGHLELAAAPLVSLGQSLSEGGPQVTNINMSVGKEGVSTTYEFRTWSPRFGIIPKNFIDRVQRLGMTSMRLRRAIRQVGRSLWMLGAFDQFAKAGASFNQSMIGSLKVARPQTPHTGLAMRIYPDGDTGGTGVRVVGSTMTNEELIRAARANTPEIFQTTAIMSMNGLFRPFSTNPSGIVGMSHYQNPSGYTYPYAVTSFTHNPLFAGHDIEWSTWGDEYTGLNSRRNIPDATNSRGIALRAPLLLSGWGWGIDGFAYPGGPEKNGSYMDNVLTRSDAWKTGVLDCMWDDYRGVWTVHDALTVIIPSGTVLPGTVNVYDPMTGDDTGVRLKAYNWFNTSVAASGGDLKAVINFISTSSRWFVVATDCQ